MKIYVAHSSDFDYVPKLYEPLRTWAGAHQHEIFLPHEVENEGINTKEYIKTCDLVIAEVSIPSTGEGIEMGRADAAGVPIVCIYQKGSKPSGSLKFVSDSILEYASEEEMISKIEESIKSHG